MENGHNSYKNLGKRRNCMFCAISSFVTIFSKRSLLQRRQKASMWGKGLYLQFYDMWMSEQLQIHNFLFDFSNNIETLDFLSIQNFDSDLMVCQLMSCNWKRHTHIQWFIALCFWAVLLENQHCGLYVKYRPGSA